MMDVKKDESRFTIKFNPVNPRHREAVRILSEAGRCKAALIADALCMYVHYGADMGAGILRGGMRGVPPIAIQECDVAVSTVESTEVCKTSGTHAPEEDTLFQDLVDSVESFF